MQKELARHTLALVASLGILGAGCKPADRPADEMGAAPPAADTGMSGGVAPADTASAGGELSDANIVALLDEANAADSASGALAVDKATNKEVKDFARLMMSEHHALRLQGQQLAKRLNITPEPPANNPVEALVQSVTAALQAAPKGAEFDRTYIDQEIKVHEAVIDLAKQAREQADAEELKALIDKASPFLEKHLKQAQAIQQKLGPATT
jgi:putative membrane protein